MWPAFLSDHRPCWPRWLPRWTSLARGGSSWAWAPELTGRALLLLAARSARGLRPTPPLRRRCISFVASGKTWTGPLLIRAVFTRYVALDPVRLRPIVFGSGWAP